MINDHLKHELFLMDKKTFLNLCNHSKRNENLKEIYNIKLIEKNTQLKIK